MDGGQWRFVLCPHCRVRKVSGSQDLLLGVRRVQGDLIDAVYQQVTVENTGGVLLAPVDGLDAGGHVLVIRVGGHLVLQVGQLLGKEGGQQVFQVYLVYGESGSPGP